MNGEIDLTGRADGPDPDELTTKMTSAITRLRRLAMAAFTAGDCNQEEGPSGDATSPVVR